MTIPSAHGSLPGYLAIPDGPAPRPAIVVVHEVFGIDEDIRRQTDRFAKRGYLALAPDLLSHGRKWQCLRQLFGDLRRGQGRAFADIDAARRWLAARSDCTGRVGVIGYCMGGGFALLAAPRYAFAAASVNYGPVPKDADQVLAGACPILGSYGGKDRGLRAHPARLEAALTTLGVEHDIKVYPEAGHSFLNQHHGLTFTVMDKVMGAGYREAPAADAQQRIDAFFATHLGTAHAT